MTTRPTLRLTPTAWAKIRTLRDLGQTEVGGFGISSSDDYLLVEDVRLVDQKCGRAFVNFDDESVATFFDEMIDAGHPIDRFARIWIHTHPGESAEPSFVDEETFERCFGRCDWSVMMIIAENDATYARLQFRSGPGGKIHLRTAIDFDPPFAGTNIDAWEEEYRAHVKVEPVASRRSPKDRWRRCFIPEDAWIHE